MTRWVISVPVWGASYFATFARVCAPSLAAALRFGGFSARNDVCVVVHTDQSLATVLAVMPDDVDVDVRPVSSRPTYVTLQESHGDALASARVGDRVVFLNADLTISGNLLEQCENHFASGSEAVVLLGVRTAAGAEAPPAGVPPRLLLAWAWAHRHQIIRDLEWGIGTSMLPTNLFWSRGDHVVARGFHLHPVAVVKKREVRFISTIDGDLLDHFPRAAIRVVTDPDDCALCETSPPDRRFPLRGAVLTPSHVAASMASRASLTHRWLFDHRIVVCGSGAAVQEDLAVATAIQNQMDAPGRGGPSRPRRGPGSYPRRVRAARA